MASSPSSRSNWLLLGAVLAVALAAVIWLGSRFVSDPSIMPPDDFVEYWAAGHLNANGQNPYDGSLLLPLERDAGRDTDEPVMMWNPPWTLSLAMPIGLLPARLAQLLWLVTSLALIVGCSDRLWIEYGGPMEKRWIVWVLSLTFVPSLFVLQAGQIGPFILLGITGFLVAERRGLPWLAGAFGVLMAIKPHLVYLFWVSLAFWAIRQPLPRWKVIAGGVFVGLIAIVIPLASNPQVIGQYWEAVTQHTPTQWRSPTIGSYLREALGEEKFGLQYIPMVIGFAWLAGDAWHSRSRSWNWLEQMPVLLLVSFVTASYGAWPFDLVILLPAVIQVAAGLARNGDRGRTVSALAAYAAINLGALLMNRLGLTSDKFVWMAPSLLVAYLIFRSRPAAP
jgi:hypothetical protein